MFGAALLINGLSALSSIPAFLWIAGVESANHPSQRHLPTGFWWVLPMEVAGGRQEAGEAMFPCCWSYLQSRHRLWQWQSWRWASLTTQGSGRLDSTIFPLAPEFQAIPNLWGTFSVLPLQPFQVLKPIPYVILPLFKTPCVLLAGHRLMWRRIRNYGEGWRRAVVRDEGNWGPDHWRSS